MLRPDNSSLFSSNLPTRLPHSENMHYMWLFSKECSNFSIKRINAILCSQFIHRRLVFFFFFIYYPCRDTLVFVYLAERGRCKVVDDCNFGFKGMKARVYRPIICACSWQLALQDIAIVRLGGLVCRMWRYCLLAGTILAVYTDNPAGTSGRIIHVRMKTGVIEKIFITQKEFIYF